VNNTNFVSHSFEWQDFFVAAVTDKKYHGTYLEIGANDPKQFSNTYLLETQLGWRGVGVEKDKTFADLHLDQRTNACVCDDATTIDYDALLTKHNLGPHIDYLQLDIDPTDMTYRALTMIDFDKYSFSVITYEHDYYVNTEYNDQWRQKSRAWLRQHGYTMVVEDVIPPNQTLSHEDWWINEKHINSDTWKLFVGKNIYMHNDFTVMDQRYRKLFENILEL